MSERRGRQRPGSRLWNGADPGQGHGVAGDDGAREGQVPEQDSLVIRVVVIQLPDDGQSPRVGGAQFTQSGRAGDPLAGRRVDDGRRRQAARGQPVRCQEGGPDAGHSRAVGVGLGADPRPRPLGALDQPEHPVGVPDGGAVDVAVVHAGTGLAGRADDLLGTVHGPVRGELDEVARVGEGRHPAGRGERRHPQVLPGSRSWRVPDQQADSQRPVGDIGFQDAQDAVDFGRGSSALPPRVREVGEQRLRLSHRA